MNGLVHAGDEAKVTSNGCVVVGDVTVVCVASVLGSGGGSDR